MNGFKADDLDVYRLKTATNDRERVQVMREAVAKAVERAQINYLYIQRDGCGAAGGVGAVVDDHGDQSSAG